MDSVESDKGEASSSSANIDEGNVAVEVTTPHKELQTLPPLEVRTQGRGLPWSDEIAMEFLGLYLDWAEYPFFHNLKGNSDVKDMCRQV